ncbi:hypothetical protein Tco_0443116 [Tanacetum coccineum]
MSTQQDIYAAGSENSPPMLNKENYVPWSSLLLWNAKSRPNGKLIYNSIMNGPYVRRMIPEPGDADREMEADDQAIQTILLGLPEDIYAAVDSCETAQEIWLRVQQMMKGSDIGIQEKKAKLFNKWERFTSTEGESIESYYHHFSKLMNDFKRNKHFPEKIASNLKFLNNLQPEWSRHYNQKEVDDLRAERLAKTHDPLALMNGYNAVQNVRNQVVQNAVQNPGVQNVGNQNGLIVVPGIANQNPNGNGNVVAARAEGNAIGNNVRPRRRDVAYLQTQLLIAQKEEAGIQLHAEEFDLIAAAADLDEIEEVNANCILMANLQQASTSGTQTDKAPVYDSNGLAEVHNYDNCYDNEIFNMFTQEEQYTELLEPIPEPHQVQQNDSNVISEVSSMEQSGGTVDQHPATVEETRAYFESLYNNLAIEVEKVNSVNRKMKETNANLTTELARYKNQEKCFEISQEKYDKLERCYQKSVYQEQCLTKKINALHLSSGKQITTLNEEISNLNKQLSKEKSTVSSLLEEKKKLKSDFKIREDELLDKQIQLENKIKELDNILVKTEATKFVRYFKSLTEEADESRAKHKALELEIERLLQAVVSHDIMSIVLNPRFVETSNLHTELDRTKERFENCIIKKENEYAKLWNDWYKKCEECTYDKIWYDKACKDMQQKSERLQAELEDQKGKCEDTPCVSDTFDPLSHKLENKNVELEF